MSSKPVQLLYHGTSFKHSASIEEQGLIKINYDKVYLTADLEVAYNYAKRKQVNENDYSGIVICIIDAPQMVKDGFTFEHQHTHAEWTIDNVPSRYILQVIIESYDELLQLAHYAQEQVLS